MLDSYSRRHQGLLSRSAFASAAACFASHVPMMWRIASGFRFATPSCPVWLLPNVTQAPAVSSIGRGAPGTCAQIPSGT